MNKKLAPKELLKEIMRRVNMAKNEIIKGNEANYTLGMVLQILAHIEAMEELKTDEGMELFLLSNRIGDNIISYRKDNIKRRAEEQERQENTRLEQALKDYYNEEGEGK